MDYVTKVLPRCVGVAETMTYGNQQTRRLEMDRQAGRIVRAGERGMTLIEIMVVMVLLGLILGAVVVGGGSGCPAPPGGCTCMGLCRGRDSMPAVSR